MSDLLIAPEIVDPETKFEEPNEAHLIGPIYDDDGNKISGSTRFMEALVNGTPVTALCGYVWVPSREGGKLPICEACKAIHERKGD